MSPHTGRRVETWLLSPACGPRLGHRGGGGVFMSPPCPRGRAIALGAPSVGACRVSLGGGSPFVASFPRPRCWGLVGGLACGVRAGPQGESSPWAA